MNYDGTDTCFACGRDLVEELFSLVEWGDRRPWGGVDYSSQRDDGLTLAWCSRECVETSIPSLAGPRCDACGLSLTPTPEQLRALERFGNPLRRVPCLETEDGLHVVAEPKHEAA